MAPSSFVVAPPRGTPVSYETEQVPLEDPTGVCSYGIRLVVVFDGARYGEMHTYLDGTMDAIDLDTGDVVLLDLKP